MLVHLCVSVCADGYLLAAVESELDVALERHTREVEDLLAIVRGDAGRVELCNTELRAARCTR